MEIANKCMEATFSLTGEDGLESVEGVQVIKYLGRTMYQSDDEWQTVLIKISKS